MTRRDLAVLAIVALLGVADLAFPFEGVQALYAIGAKSVAHGAVLYRDFWDLKQPGTYVFYLLGGLIFGFREVGIHIFELLYWLAFARVLQVALRGTVADPRFASYAPLFVIVPYYAGSVPDDLTQVEPLVQFPLFVFCACALALFTKRGPSRWLAFIVGVSAGFVILWKLLFAIVLVAILAAIALRTRARLEQLDIYAAICGFAVPVGAFLAYVSVNHEWNLVANTFFQVPLEIARQIPSGPLTRLGFSAREFVRNDLIVLALTFVGVYEFSQRDRATRDAAVAWIVAGLAVILMQRQSWWPYHFDLLLVPFGILGLLGFEAIAAAVRGNARRTTEVTLVVIACIAPLGLDVARNVARLATHGFALGTDRRLAYQAASSVQATEGIEAAKFLIQPNALPGDIYVAGDPTVYWYTGRGQAVPLNGWSLEFFVDDQWSQLESELAAVRPPYVYVSDVYRTTFPQATPSLDAWFKANYRVGSDSPLGTWFVVDKRLSPLPRSGR